MMLTAVVRSALQHPWLVLFGATLLVLYGGATLSRAEYEVFPEFVPGQITVQTEAPGLAAEQVELLVTRALENAINGATGIATVRSESVPGFSVVNIVFREGEDAYRARQMVAERVAEVAGRLPIGTGTPVLSPLTSSTMDLLKLGLIAPKMTPTALRDLADWTIKPRLLSVPGVASVTIFGGEVSRLEVRVDAVALLARGLAVADVITAVRAATAIHGGGFVDSAAQRIQVEVRGNAMSAGELAHIIVAPSAASPVPLSAIAEVVDAPAPKFGDALIMGQPGVLIALTSQFGTNTLTATKAVEVALAELKPGLEAQGVTLFPALHRPANFIETALAGVRGDLALGAVLITLVIVTLTLDLRVAFTAFVSIPLSLLATILVLDLTGTTINTMTLGGLAVALGVVIDDAIIGIENILRRLRERGAEPPLDVILAASVEVRAPVVYATLVLALTMLPVLLLSGLQGAFFGPLAQSFLLAILASLGVAVTVIPALTYLLLRHAQPAQEPALLRASKHLYEKVLIRVCRAHGLAALLTLLLGVGAIAVSTKFGGELLPAFRERHYVLQIAGPSGASLEWMREIGQRLATDLLRIPGIATLEAQIGRAEAGVDTFPPHRAEFHVELDAVGAADENRILHDIRKVLHSYPGLQSHALTFLGDRVGESLSGETAAIAINVFGSDLEVLDRIAAQIVEVAGRVPGALDVQIKAPPGAPSLWVELNQQRMTARGVGAQEVYDTLGAAYQGVSVGQVLQGEKVRDVVLTIPSIAAQAPETARDLTVHGLDGSRVKLGDVATLKLVASRAAIIHEGGRRRQVVTVDANTDIAGLAARIERAIAKEIRLPEGVYLNYSGVAEGEAAAVHQLGENVALAAIGVIALLVVAFGGWRPAVLILAGTPAALAGGVAAIAVTGGVLSLGALVGFVTLFGIAARNSILLVAHGDHLVAHEGARWGMETVVRATRERFTPILMTALVTALGMAPLAIQTGEAGREVQGPMATVILGGLVSSTIFSLILLPPLILAFRRSPQPGLLTAPVAKA